MNFQVLITALQHSFKQTFVIKLMPDGYFFQNKKKKLRKQ